MDDFTAFVASRSPRLARTAFLLTRDHGHAEDLLQTALAKSWLAWPRIYGDPERYASASAWSWSRTTSACGRRRPAIPATATMWSMSERARRG